MRSCPDVGALLRRNTEFDDCTPSGRLIRESKLAVQDALDVPHKNIVTRALGVTTAARKEPKYAIDVVGPLLEDEGDVILLCSKKVHELLSEAEVLSLVDTAEKTVSQVLDAASAAGDCFEACAIAIRVGETVRGNGAAAGPPNGR